MTIRHRACWPDDHHRGAAHLAGRGREWCDPAESGARTSERRRFGVVPGGDEEGFRDIDADAGEVEQGVGPSPDQGSELGVEPAHHGVQA